LIKRRRSSRYTKKGNNDFRPRFKISIQYLALILSKEKGILLYRYCYGGVLRNELPEAEDVKVNPLVNGSFAIIIIIIMKIFATFVVVVAKVDEFAQLPFPDPGIVGSFLSTKMKIGLEPTIFS